MTVEIRQATHMLAVAKLLHPQHVSLRAEQDAEAIEELIEALECSADLPPALVYHDGQRYWLADGECCTRARQAFGQSSVPCEVRRGTRVDAMLAGLERHRCQDRLRWKRPDRRHAALLLLQEKEQRWNNCEVARLVGYASESTVRLLRTYVQEQEEAAQEAARKRAMSLNSEIAPKPTPKPIKPTFKDEEEEVPQVETRKVKVTKGPNAGREYDYPIKPKKDLPKRKGAVKARRQMRRTIPKLERQADDGEISRVELYRELLRAAEEGRPGRDAYDDLCREKGFA